MLMFRCIPVMICLIGSLTFAESMQGRCVGVADGDTATVQVGENHQIKVRLECIDAPERNQDFGKDAKQKLSDLILDKDVSLDISTTDKYGRSVAKVNVGGTDANLEMVRSGLAWHDVKYSPDAIDFSNAEKEAREQKIGLWSQPTPTPPWDWRKRTSTNNSTSPVTGIEKQANTTSTKTENTMITTMATGSFSETVGAWLLYSMWSMLNSWVNATIIVGGATLLLIGGVGFMWGRLWNKTWILNSGNRGVVIVLSLLSAIALGGVNQMYGGGFFDTSMKETVETSTGLYIAPIAKENAAFGKMMRQYQRAAALDDSSLLDATEKLDSTEDDAYLIPSFSAKLEETYKSALWLLWLLFGSGCLILFAIVAYKAYSNIDEVRPVCK